MTTNAADVRLTGSDDPVTRYAPSWLEQLIDALDGLPGSRWLAYLGFGILIGIVTQVQAWENGKVPPGEFNPPTIYWAFMATALLWCANYVRNLAGRSFDAFRPAFLGSDAEANRLRYELATIPARAGWLIFVVAVAVTVAAFLFGPEDAGVIGLSVPMLVAAFATQTLAAAVLFALGYQLLRQMRLVRQAMSQAAVDLFQPGPLQALSRLTSRFGIALVVIVTSSVLFLAPPPDFASMLVNWAPFVVVPPAIAAIAFVVPLSGMHERLEAEKARVANEADARLRAILAEINSDVDAGDLSRADGLNKTLSSLLQQRDLVAKLPTWPWSTGTFRALVTAILLPLFLFLVQRILSQVI